MTGNHSHESHGSLSQDRASPDMSKEDLGNAEKSVAGNWTMEDLFPGN